MRKCQCVTVVTCLIPNKQYYYKQLWNLINVASFRQIALCISKNKDFFGCVCHPKSTGTLLRMMSNCDEIMKSNKWDAGDLFKFTVFLQVSVDEVANALIQTS